MRKSPSAFLQTTPDMTDSSILGLTESTSDKSSVFHKLLIIFWIVGIPVWFASSVLSSGQVASFIPNALLILFATTSAFTLRKSVLNKVHIMLYLFFLVLLTTTFLAILVTNPFATQAQITSLIGFFSWSSIFFSIYNIVNTQTLYRFAMKLINVLGIAIALTVFLSYVCPTYLGFPFGEILYEPIIRPIGPFGDQVGFVLGYYVLHYLVHRKWLGATLCMAAILVTATRGAVISVFTGVVWLAFNILKIQSQKSRATILLIFMALIGIVYTSTSQDLSISDRFTAIFLYSDSLAQRTNAIELGFRVYWSSPLLGVGYLGFNRFAGEYNFDAVRGAYTTQNQYLQTLTDAGLLGLATLGIFLFTLQKELRLGQQVVQSSQQLDLLAYLAWVIAMGIGNLGAVWLLPGAISTYFFFLMAGLELSIIQIHRSKL